MKLLHTSDLHLGHRLLEQNRHEEQRRLLDYLVGLVESEGIDLLIVAGDIFDTAAPSNAALRLYYDFLHRIGASGCAASVVIGGNHDSASTLNAPKELLRHFRVQVVGGAADAADELFLAKNDEDEPLALIGCVPFLRERDLRIPKPGESFADRDEGLARSLADHYRRLAEAASPKPEDLPFIVTGHLFAAGSVSALAGGERDLYVGNLGQVNPTVFPENADYVALGHIHSASMVGGEKRIRYSGAPMALDFGDSSLKSVTLVEFDGFRIVSVEELPVPVFRRLEALSGPLSEILWRLGDLAGRGEELTPWLDICVQETIPGAQEQIEEACRGLSLEVLRVRYARTRENDAAWEEAAPELEELEPEEVFRRRCIAGEVDPDEELLRAFNELLLEAEGRL